jgi:hypothetical protein
MSVWEEPSYQTECLSTVLRLISITDIAHPFMSIFKNLPSPNPEMNAVQFLKNNPLNARIYEPRAFSMSKCAFLERMPKIWESKCLYGIEAVYSLFVETLDGNIAWPKERYVNEKWLLQYVTRVMELAGYASYQSKRHYHMMISEQFADLKKPWIKMMIKYEKFKEGFRHLKYFHRAASYVDKERKAKLMYDQFQTAPSSLIWFGKGWEVFKAEQLIVIEKQGTYESVFYILTRKDINRLEQMSASISSMSMYFGLYDYEEDNALAFDEFKKVLTIIADSMRENTNLVARAADVVMYRYLAELSSDFWDKSLNEQEDKIARESLHTIIRVRELLSIYRRNSIGLGIELSKIYKFLPCPDFDIFSLSDEQEKKHKNPNTFETHTSLTLEYNVSIKEFEKYQLIQAMQTYHRRHNSLPGRIRTDVEIPEKWREWSDRFPYVTLSSITLETIEFIDLTASFHYVVHDDLVNESIKDSSLAPHGSFKANDETELDKLGPRNYLTHYLKATNLNNTQTTFVQMGSISWSSNQSILIAPKPESKKPVPRNFYIAEYAVREAFSELESNIGGYLEFKKGTYQGKTYSEVFAKMYDIMGTEMEHAISNIVLVSFDISGWSPRMNPALKRSQELLWSKLFGYKELQNIKTYYENVNVSWVKKGVNKTYKLNGNDLEGFSGKMNTFMHIDIMAYAVRKLREAKLLTGGAKFAAQIDDGICALPFHKNVSKEKIKEALQFIQDVYKFFSLEIAWDKTFVSKEMYIYLNDVFYKGAKTQVGLKAFLRIRAQEDSSEMSFLGQKEEIEGMVRGAVTAGVNVDIAFLKYAWELGKLVRRWKPKSDFVTLANAEVHAFQSVIPTNFGGYGVSIPLWMMGNIVDDIATASIGALRAISFYDKLARDKINKIIQQPIAKKSPLQILRQPTSFKIEATTLTSTKENTFIELALRKVTKNQLVSSALEVPQEDIVKEFVSIFDSEVNVRKELIAAYYKSSPLFIIDWIIGRFRRSRTLISVLGYKVYAKLLCWYKLEYLTVIKNFANIL